MNPVNPRDEQLAIEHCIEPVRGHQGRTCGYCRNFLLALEVARAEERCACGGALRNLVLAVRNLIETGGVTAGKSREWQRLRTRVSEAEAWLAQDEKPQ